jgi:hypothetical protein
VHSLIVIQKYTFSTPSHTLDVTGHNLNLGHAGEGTVEYGDESGMMVSCSVVSINEVPTSTYHVCDRLKQ